MEKKAENLKILDISQISSIAEYFILCSGASDRQVLTIAEHIISTMKKKKIRSIGIEGLRDGRWVVIDYGNLVIHVFHDPVREFYDFDELWSLGVELKVLEK